MLSSAQVEIGRWLALVGVLVLGAVYVKNGISNKQTIFRLLLPVALLYPLGKFVQFWGVGPTIFKSYMSDIGFVPCFAVTMGLLAHMHRSSITQAALERARYWCTFSSVIAVGFELIEILA